jgi:hypothetical protein
MSELGDLKTILAQAQRRRGKRRAFHAKAARTRRWEDGKKLNLTTENTEGRREKQKLNHEKREKHERKAKISLIAEECGGMQRKSFFNMDGQDGQDKSGQDKSGQDKSADCSSPWSHYRLAGF